MLLDGGEQLIQFRSSGDQFDQTVKLFAARLAVQAAVRVGIKDTVNQLLNLVVHNLTHCVTTYTDEQSLRDLTLIWGWRINWRRCVGTLCRDF